MTEALESEVAVQPTPIETIQAYLAVLQGENMAAYVAAEGMYDEAVVNNTPYSSSTECHTYNTICAFEEYKESLETASPDVIDTKRKSFDDWRVYSALHVVRSMVQGGKFPVEDFGAVITSVLDTIAIIEKRHTAREKHRRYVREEINDVLDCEYQQIGRGSSDPKTLRRAAEAYKYVGKPRIFGRIMKQVAKLELAAVS